MDQQSHEKEALPRVYLYLCESVEFLNMESLFFASYKRPGGPVGLDWP